MEKKRVISRRSFLKSTAAVSLGAASVGASGVFAAGSDELKVGIIGCGDRGVGAVTQSLLAPRAGTKLWAMGDLFTDRLDKSYNLLAKGAKGRYDRNDIGSLLAKMDVPAERKFVGFDAYKKVLATDIDIVLLACPPGFRPLHLKAAIEAGKHVFMEKPAGVDPAGIRSVIETSKLAEKKGLSIVAGTQRRHQFHYRDIMNRIHDGQIGDIRSAEVYWNSGDMLGYWPWYEKGNMSGMEWQCRSWPWFVWTSGDHIVEQHVHNLDIANWAMGANPVMAMGMGGRARRTQGNIWDNFAIEFEYPGGIKVTSMCRQINGCSAAVSERIVGTKGIAYTDGGVGRIIGEKEYEYKGKNVNPYIQEHADLLASIRSGKPINEARQVAESTMNAIVGRMSAYTGRSMKWDWAMKASNLDLAPKKYDLSEDIPMRPVAVQGVTKLI